jgi:DNA-binding transcriptional ArsR family regulator
VPDTLNAVFGALADPRRRFVLETLARRGSVTPTELAGELPVTRQAVAKHLAALQAAGLVERSRAGREARYRLTPAPLGEVSSWLDRVGAEWDERLLALQRHLETPGAASAVGRSRREDSDGADGLRSP